MVFLGAPDLESGISQRLTGPEKAGKVGANRYQPQRGIQGVKSIRRVRGENLAWDAGGRWRCLLKR